MLSSVVFNAKAQFYDAGSFRDGFYYDSHGVKHVGLVKFKTSKEKLFGLKTKLVSSFIFKTDLNAEKQIIEAVNTKSVVALADSFIVHTIFSVDKKGGKMTDTTVLFLQVDLNNGDNSIYKAEYGLTGFHNGAGTSFTDYVIYDHYYYGDNMDNAIIINNDNFVEVMSKFVKDSPVLVSKIKSRKYTFEDIGFVLADYKKEKGIAENIPDWGDGAHRVK
ncbi:MAG: hypothetical protein JWR54_908 [Mucilaginibacter sp.]|nr:hypothetical protein [Mucilaginibacter sp.]